MSRLVLLVVICINTPSQAQVELPSDGSRAENCEGAAVCDDLQPVVLLQSSLSVSSSKHTQSRSKPSASAPQSVNNSGALTGTESWLLQERASLERPIAAAGATLHLPDPKSTDIRASSESKFQLPTQSAWIQVLISFFRYAKPLLMKCHWLLAAIGAIPLAICINCDDALWLMPFTVGRKRTRYGLMYIVTMQLLAVAAWYASGHANKLAQSFPFSSNLPTLRAATTCAWMLYALVLLSFWVADRARRAAPIDDADLCIKGKILRPLPEPCMHVEKSSEKGVPLPFYTACEEDTSDGEDPDETSTWVRWYRAGMAREEITLTQFLAFMAIGSLDNFAVFMALLQSGILTGPELCFVVQVSSCLVAAACCRAGVFRAVAHTAKGVPLWCIAGSLGVWVLLGARP